MKKKRKNIDWTNHIIELTVVFIGISLAFTLDNWREDLKNQELETQYLNSFFSDISDDALALYDIIKISESKERRAARFIGQLKNTKAVNDSAILIIADIMTKMPFSPKLSTYESIKSSGNLNILSDYDLKKEIIGYYQSLIDKNMKEDIYNTYIDTYAVPYVYKNLDFLKHKLINKNITTQRTFHNLVLGYHTLLVQNLHTYMKIIEENQKLKTHISVILN